MEVKSMYPAQDFKAIKLFKNFFYILWLGYKGVFQKNLKKNVDTYFSHFTLQTELVS